MPEIWTKELLANIAVVIPTAGVVGGAGIYFAKKFVDQVISRMDSQDRFMVEMRSEIVGKPVHFAAMESHEKRMDRIEEKSKDDIHSRDVLLSAVGEAMGKKADELGLAYVREDVQAIMNDVSEIKKHLTKWTIPFNIET